MCKQPSHNYTSHSTQRRTRKPPAPTPCIEQGICDVCRRNDTACVQRAVREHADNCIAKMKPEASKPRLGPPSEKRRSVGLPACVGMLAPPGPCSRARHCCSRCCCGGLLCGWVHCCADQVGARARVWVCVVWLRNGALASWWYHYRHVQSVCFCVDRNTRTTSQLQVPVHLARPPRRGAVALPMGWLPWQPDDAGAGGQLRGEIHLRAFDVCVVCAAATLSVRTNHRPPSPGFLTLNTEAVVPPPPPPQLGKTIIMHARVTDCRCRRRCRDCTNELVHESPVQGRRRGNCFWQ